MKDTEARARILVLESHAHTMVHDIVEAIRKDMRPTIDRFNEAADTLNALASQLAELDALAHETAKALTAQAELLEIMESDHKGVESMFEDLGSIVDEVQGQVRNIITGLGQIGRSA